MSEGDPVLLGSDGKISTALYSYLAFNATQPLNSKGNSFTTVQAAIDDMDVAGWVYAPPGTYTEAVDIVGKNNIMLFGAGWGMTKITYAGNDHTLNIDNSDDVIIRDLRIDQTSTGNAVNAIRIDDAQRCKISNVYIGDSDDKGIDFVDAVSADCEISSCYITGADDGGIFDDGGFCSNLVVSKSVIQSCVSVGIYMLSNKVRIENNMVKLNGGDGINIDIGYITVINNVCIENGKHGIIGYNALNSIIVNNLCVDNSWGNSNLYDGIYLKGASHSTIANNICYDDHSGCATAGCQRHGIYVYQSEYNTISGNITRDNLTDGIKIHGTSGNLADYNTLNGNVCEGNGGKGIYIFGDKGNAHDYANKNIVLGNQLFDNTGTNLDDDGTATEKGHNITA